MCISLTQLIVIQGKVMDVHRIFFQNLNVGFCSNTTVQKLFQLCRIMNCHEDNMWHQDGREKKPCSQHEEELIMLARHTRLLGQWNGLQRARAIESHFLRSAAKLETRFMFKAFCVQDCVVLLVVLTVYQCNYVELNWRMNRRQLHHWFPLRKNSSANGL